LQLTSGGIEAAPKRSEGTAYSPNRRPTKVFSQQPKTFFAEKARRRFIKNKSGLKMLRILTKATSLKNQPTIKKCLH
jgi:hypothetical protein